MTRQGDDDKMMTRQRDNEDKKGKVTSAVSENEDNKDETELRRQETKRKLPFISRNTCRVFLSKGRPQGNRRREQ